MRAQKMMQNMQQVLYMGAIPTLTRPSDVVHNHVANDIGASGSARQIFGEPAGYGLGHMFVLGDRQNFFFGQTAEGNAILQTDHDELVC